MSSASHIFARCRRATKEQCFTFLYKLIAVPLVLRFEQNKVKGQVSDSFSLWNEAKKSVKNEMLQLRYFSQTWAFLPFLTGFFFSTPWNGCLRKAFVKTNWVRLLSILIQGFVLGWWEWARESLNKYLRPPSTSLSSLHPGPICGGTAGGGGVVASSHCFPWMQPGKEGSKRETNIPWDVEFDSCQYSEGNTEAARTVHLTS